MERLTDNYDYCFLTCYEQEGDLYGEECPWYKNCHERQIFEKLKHYEDLAEQGRLIELPCKVGDTVWSTRWWDNKKISKKIDGEIWYRDIFQHKITKEKFSLYDLDKIGKDVFLTKEEAEAKLKELKEGAE